MMHSASMLLAQNVLMMNWAGISPIRNTAVEREGEALDDLLFADGDVEVFDFQFGHVKCDQLLAASGTVRPRKLISMEEAL